MFTFCDCGFFLAAMGSCSTYGVGIAPSCSQLPFQAERQCSRGVFILSIHVLIHRSWQTPTPLPHPPRLCSSKSQIIVSMN